MKSPQIISVKASPDCRLLVEFSDGLEKIYDCTPLLNMERFAPLKDKVLFKQVQVDTGGYGVSWNDEIDLSEYELWTRGVPLDGFTVNR